MEKRRTTGPRIGPRITAPQPAPPPTHVQIGTDRFLPGAREVDIAQIRPDPDQPRRTMNHERLGELAASIERHGLLQPLVVRQDGLTSSGDMRYVVIAGGRRYAALRMLVDSAPDQESRTRFSRVMVVVNESEAAERRILQLIENVQREDLSPVEEARTLKEIMRVEGLSSVQLAARVHRSQGYVDERLRLLRHEAIEAAVEAGRLTKSAGAAIASLPSAAAREAWLARADAGETIRPREVYASKGTPRSSLPKFGSSAEGGQVKSEALAAAALPNFGSAARPADTPMLPSNVRAEAQPKFGSHGANDEHTAAIGDKNDQLVRRLEAFTAQLENLSIPDAEPDRVELRRPLRQMRDAIERLLDTLQEPDRGSIAARSVDSL